MKILNSKPTLIQLQWLIWGFVFLAIALSLMQMDGFGQAVVYALLNTCFYAAIVYGNISLLYKRLYQKGRKFIYVIATVAFLLGIAAIRMVVSLWVYNALFAKQPEHLSIKAYLSTLFGGLMVFILSFVFRIAIAYFTLKRQADEIIAQRTEAELNLLKSQVQPHFLFNTLNNIYYEAYLEAPRTAALIERLSDIMRYFVDESPRQQVSLATEVQFLENYIALEKIRIRFNVDINIAGQYHASTLVPPMLLMTFVENVFKHGIDKSSELNKVDIRLDQKNDRLIFSVENTLCANPSTGTTTGFGLANLRKRLVLLYGNNFELYTSNTGNTFIATLNIPLA
ncbi:hypothetical protein FPZ43_05005 [Mucilaginibacter pallidiroseus]|uniref:Signal transduction histidine kinase internal region domain-containing protein n=1 Tax=Mucilaginibacter pallidiroseus TaxID=2599295 RepID=A0A563UFZ1_9SPHI|nr:histidine kinase [Mucilaginibacter pallidiroseus]TWR30300.1 hypothetical protein FPZ43_05005 [Mucilaginibacter pallidiroseus]